MLFMTIEGNECAPAKVRVKPMKMLERLAGYWLIKLVIGILRILPHRAMESVGAGLGLFFQRISKRSRRDVKTNFDVIYPAMPQSERDALERRVFINFGKTAAEFLCIPRMTPQAIADCSVLEGIEHLDTALAKGKGVLLISAHFGNWELLAAKLIALGYPIDAIARDPELPATADLLREIRKSTVQRSYPRNSILPAVRGLKQNRVLAILPDQHDCDGLLVNFMGHPAMAAPGPAAIAWLTGAAVVPVFSYRQPDDSFMVKFSPEVILEKSADKDYSIHHWTQQIMDVISEKISATPDQWLWLHNRWRPTTGAKRLEEYR